MIVAIPSSGRPGNVERMQEQLAPLLPTWYVPADQQRDYLAAGAVHVREGSGVNVARARNRILDDVPHDDVVVQLDDDLRRVRWVQSMTDHPRRTVDRSVPDALAEMVSRLVLSDYRLAGAAPTDNAFFCNRRTSVNLFCRAGVLAIKVGTLRFDEQLRAKSDYDFCLQNLHQYGGWMRCDDLLFSFQQRAVAGGMYEARQHGADQHAVEYLQSKWPGLVRPHSTRTGEVTLRVPRRVTA